MAALAAHFDEMQQQSDSTDKADAVRKTLAANPDDAAAHTALGSHLCFALDQWDEGLDHLARGNDEALSKAAKAERAGGRQPAEQAKIGDAWYDAAANAATASRPAMLAAPSGGTIRRVAAPPALRKSRSTSGWPRSSRSFRQRPGFGLCRRRRLSVRSGFARAGTAIQLSPVSLAGSSRRKTIAARVMADPAGG